MPDYTIIQFTTAGVNLLIFFVSAAVARIKNSKLSLMVSIISLLVLISFITYYLNFRAKMKETKLNELNTKYNDSIDEVTIKDKEIKDYIDNIDYIFMHVSFVPTYFVILSIIVYMINRQKYNSDFSKYETKYRARQKHIKIRSISKNSRPNIKLSEAETLPEELTTTEPSYESETISNKLIKSKPRYRPKIKLPKAETVPEELSTNIQEEIIRTVIE
jgi:hypothetical protein